MHACGVKSPESFNGDNVAFNITGNGNPNGLIILAALTLETVSDAAHFSNPDEYSGRFLAFTINRLEFTAEYQFDGNKLVNADRNDQR